MNDDKSILHLLEQHGHKPARVRLRGTQRNDEATERYEIVGEIARGGVGIVHRGRDNDLGRDVALKVLRDGNLANPEMVQRFVEEAQIGGQLQHPGIVPVYELGMREDQRPYFAMKLVKGETLAARLAKGIEPRRALLAVFREVCRTVAYAHARGVIHRDLKPSNVMIGNFGEVQVVDWGFAKVLRRGGVADERLAKKAERDITMISTVRSDEGSAPSVAGSVMGTPAYMPPEQALGRVDDLDEKSDLFSLGAILAEILTGKPPYTGADRMNGAEQALLEPVFRRLDESGANAKLVDLCKRCLQPLPKDRPASAEVLADEVAAYLRSAELRSHRARLRTMRAEARAAAQRRARRLTMLAGTSVAAALLVALGAYLWLDAGRTGRERARQAKIEAALQDAARLQAAARWDEALAAAERAVALGDDGTLARRIRTETAQAEERKRRLREEARLLADLEEARSMAGDHYSARTIDAAYVTAIKERWPSGEVDVQRLVDSPLRAALAAAFDAWAFLRFDGNRKAGGGGYEAAMRGIEADWREVEAWARALDPDSNHVRDALFAPNCAALVALVEREDLSGLPVAMLATVGAALNEAGRKDAAIQFLRRALRRCPDDFWLHMRMASSARKVERELAVRHAHAALAIRPESLEARHYLGILVWETGDLDGAIEVWRDALKRKPDWAHGMLHISDTLVKQGKPEAALEVFRQAIRSGHCVAASHARIGIIQRDELERNEQSLESLRRAVELDPGSDMAHNELGNTLMRMGKLDDAEEAYRTAIRLDPADASNYGNLGELLRRRGRLDEALAKCRKAVQLAPRTGVWRNNLGLVLLDAGKWDGAIVSIEEANKLDPDNVHVWNALGCAYLKRAQQSRPANPDDLNQAITWLRKASEREAIRFHALVNLGNALTFAGGYREAIDVLRKARSIEPDSVAALFNLGNALNWDKQHSKAIVVLRRAKELARSDARVVAVLASALSFNGDTEAAIAEYRHAVSLSPNDALTRYNLGSVLWRTSDVGLMEEALSHFQKAVGLEQDYDNAWGNYGLCLRDLGRWSEAVDALRRCVWASELVAETERMVALEPKLLEAMSGADIEVTPAERAVLAVMLRAKRRHALSVAYFKGAFRADSSLTKIERKHLYRAIWSAAEGGASFRDQALAWCRAYLAQVRGLPKADRAHHLDRLEKNAELAPIRDADSLSDEWKQFWADVAALRAEAEQR